MLITGTIGTTNTSIGTACDSNQDCSGTNVECYAGTCLCTPGYSLKPDAQTCQSSTGFRSVLYFYAFNVNNAGFYFSTVQLCLDVSLSNVGTDSVLMQTQSLNQRKILS